MLTSVKMPLAADQTTLYAHSPLPLCVSTTFKSSFLRGIPDIAPRTVCDCQPVANISFRLIEPCGWRRDRMLHQGLLLDCYDAIHKLHRPAARLEKAPFR